MSEETIYPVSKLIKKFNRLATKDIKNDADANPDERQELLNRLKLSRDELDAYIRHTKKVISEKKALEIENTEMRTKLDVSSLKITRLEKQEATLTKECSDLLKMVCEFCPSGVWESQTLQITETKVIQTLKNSIFTMLEDRHLNSVIAGKTEEELAARTAELTAANSIIVGLSEEIDRLNQIVSNITNPVFQKSISTSNSISSNTLPITNTSNGESASPAPEEIIDHPSEWADKEVTYNVEEIVDAMNDILMDINSKVSNINNNLSLKLSKNEQAAQMPPVDSIALDREIKNSDFYWNLFKSKLSTNMEQLTTLITNMSSKMFELSDENSLSSKEVASLKYALSCRIELQNIRANAHNAPCNCKKEIEKLQLQVSNLITQVEQKQVELDEANENRLTLLQVMASMGGEVDDNEEQPVEQNQN